MTLPTLVAKYQMKTFEVAFKKQYSVLNNTIDYLSLEQGLTECNVYIDLCPTEDNPLNDCYFAKYSDCAALKNGIVEKLKLTPISKDGFKYTLNTNDILNAGGVAVNKFVDLENVYRYLNGYLLADGAVVFFAPSSANMSYTNTTFVVDINGKKAPNKWGYDVFMLTLTNRNGKIRLTDEYASIAEKGGRLPRAILTNDAAKGNGRLW